MKNVTPMPAVDAPARPTNEIDADALRTLLSETDDTFTQRAFGEFLNTCTEGLSEEKVREKPSVADRMMRFELEFPDGEKRTGRMSVVQLYEILADASHGRLQMRYRYLKNRFQ